MSEEERAADRMTQNAEDAKKQEEVDDDGTQWTPRERTWRGDVKAEMCQVGVCGGGVVGVVVGVGGWLCWFVACYGNCGGGVVLCGCIGIVGVGGGVVVGIGVVVVVVGVVVVVVVVECDCYCCCWRCDIRYIVRYIVQICLYI
jgi:hypothetical protein